MKLFLFLALLSPLLSHADVEPNLQERLDQMQPRWNDTPTPDRSPAPHRVTWWCVAKDARGTTYQSSWTSYSLQDAERRGMAACVGLFRRQGCRLVRCFEQL